MVQSGNAAEPTTDQGPAVRLDDLLYLELDRERQQLHGADVRSHAHVRVEEHGAVVPLVVGVGRRRGPVLVMVDDLEGKVPRVDAIFAS